MQIDKIAFFGDSYCADFEDTYIEQLSKDYEILHLGEPGHGLNWANEQFRNFLNGFTEFNNTFFVFMNSSSIRKQIQHPPGEYDLNDKLAERPLPFSNEANGDEDFEENYIKAIQYHELYIQNDNEDARNYLNAIEAQQWLLYKFKIKSFKRFLCFRYDAERLNCPLNFYHNNLKYTNLSDFSNYFTEEAIYKADLKNHFCPKGHKAMEQVLREAINECTN